MTGTKLLPGQASLPTPNSTNSFWHSQPSKILLGHRTTESLPTEADLVIVGSGLSGTSAAHFLREDEAGKNLKVVMLEAREACWGATGRVSPLPFLPRHKETNRAIYSRSHHRMEATANPSYTATRQMLAPLRCATTSTSKPSLLPTTSLVTGELSALLTLTWTPLCSNAPWLFSKAF